MCLFYDYVDGISLGVGRFDKPVIEERRQCSEDLLQFSANIPALYNSQHIQDFFKVSHHLCRDPSITTCTLLISLFMYFISCFFKGGEVHDGSELIGPAEPFSDFLTDSLSDCSSDGRGSNVVVQIFWRKVQIYVTPNWKKFTSDRIDELTASLLQHQRIARLLLLK